MMTFEQARAYQAELEKAVAWAGVALRSLSGGDAMGLTPDRVKATPEYQTAKGDYQTAFSRLRTWNSVYLKEFKAEFARSAEETR